MYILAWSRTVSCPKLRIVSKAGPGRRFPGVALTGLLAVLALLSAAPSGAQPAVRQVLMLQSFDRGTLPVDHFTSDFRVELDKRATEHVNVVQVVVGPRGSVAASDQAIVDYIRSLFVDHPKPDLIVTAAGPAAVFARKYRQQLFPDAPILFASVDRQFLDDAPLGDNETAVAVDNQFSGTIETILQLLPETRQVFMVMGSGPLGRFWRRDLESQFGRFRDRLTFVWSNDLSIQEVLRRCTSLPEHSAILYISFGADVAGASFPDERLFAELRDTANAPLFAGQSVYLGSGIVESYRDCRRAHSLRGWSLCHARQSIPLRYENGPSGWSGSTAPSTRPNGRRSGRSRASWDAPPRRCGAGSARPSAIAASELA